ncbi:uncharacterized protein LOC131946984 [Physella acuta]|uniref:uncharacterized protein LOC131946984 n=1 Tax=Physella acuta TaxID=109671 RepID=UPI0027DC9059|nr:uncharacterized protein LOC131946984 [Physella acuta]
MSVHILLFVGLCFVTCSSEPDLLSEIKEKAIKSKGKVLAWACDYVSEDEEMRLLSDCSFERVQSLDRRFELPDPKGNKMVVWGFNKQPLKKDSNGNIIPWECIQISQKNPDGEIVIVAPNHETEHGLSEVISKTVGAGQWIGDQFKTGVKVTVDGIVYVGDKIYDGLKTASTGVVKVSEQVFKGLKDTANDVGNALKAGFNAFVSFFGGK